jgi:KDO2-lipid IV(A) lauroyltransferase
MSAGVQKSDVQDRRVQEQDAPRGKYIRPKDIDNRATLLQRIQWRIEAAAWYVLYWFPLKALPVETASNLGGRFMRAIGPRLRSTHKTVVRNLKLAFPDWRAETIAATAAESWEMLGRIAGELPHLDALQPGQVGARIEVAGDDHVEAIRNSGKPAVLIGGHLANWEVMSATICSRLDCQITYRALNNPHIDRCVARARYAAGIQVLVPKGVGARELMRALSRGQSIGLMNDQKFNQGVGAPFFGHVAMTADGATRLAKKYGVPILPLSVTKTGPARYKVTFHEPFHPEVRDTEDEAVFATVAKINAFYEARIRETPGQWFWQHHRWPKDAWRDAGVV